MKNMIRRPDVAYPCQWEYRVIGEDENALKAAVSEVLGEREHTISFSNTSKGGKYLSLSITTFIEDEKIRNRIFISLNRHPHVKLVL